jgi:hypothetical protein
MSHLKHVRVMAPLTVLLVVLSIVATTAGAFAASPVKLVSGPSPYAGCSTAGQPGTNYLNAEGRN